MMLGDTWRYVCIAMSMATLKIDEGRQFFYELDIDGMLL